MTKFSKNILGEFIKGRVLVVIDAANLESAVKDLGWWIDYVRLKKLFSRNLFEIKHYCVRHNTENQNKFFSFLKHQDFKLTTKPIKVIKIPDIEKGDLRKANFDVEITADVIKRMGKFKTLVLFSGDSDFDYMVRLLRNANKKVIVISTQNHISKELIRSCNKYLDLKKLRKFIERKKK